MMQETGWGKGGGAEGKPAKLASQSNYEAPPNPDFGGTQNILFQE